MPAAGEDEGVSLADVLRLDAEDEEGFALFICHDADVVAEVVEDGDVVHPVSMRLPVM